jgi:hypothetical protein
MLLLLASLRVVGDPAATTTANGVLDVAGVLSATTLVAAGLTALLESLLLLTSVLLLACLLLFFCLQLIGCLICCFHFESLCLLCPGVPPGCS